MSGPRGWTYTEFLLLLLVAALLGFVVGYMANAVLS